MSDTWLPDPSDVVRLRGSYLVKHTIAELMSLELRKRLGNEGGVRALGASTPAQAVQMVQAGLKGIYVSGWQVAADVNGNMYPDQSLYPADCVPKLVKAINNALLRQDKAESSKNGVTRQWLVPMVADMEAGFGGNLNVYELTLRMIEAGAAGVHLEDQLSSEKKCGHLGGKVLVPTSEFIKKLKAARLAAKVAGVETVLIARTDANSARLMTSDIDSCDRFFMNILSKRTPDGFWEIKGGLEQAIQRGLAYCPYADLIWCETSKPDIGEAREFAQAIHEKFPGKQLAYNCSPSFNWSENLGPQDIETFQDQLYDMGYVFQFITLAGFHSLNDAMYRLATDYKNRGMAAYAQLQNGEFMGAKTGYKAVRHQEFVGTGYFDDVQQVVSGGSVSTSAMKESTEEEQF